MTLSVAEMRHLESLFIRPEGPKPMEYIPHARADAGAPDALPHDQIRRYSVPAGLSPEEKFEHWRSWYGSAVDTPVRLEKTEKLVRPNFNPTALSLDGPGFSLVDVTNEPVTCYWNGETYSGSGDWLVHFRSSCDQFSFSGRSEEVSPGTVRFLDLSSPGSFHAPSGFSSVQVRFDRRLLGLDDKTVKRLQGLSDIRDNPIVRGLILPALSGWQRTGLAQEVHRLQPVVRSMITALASSLLETPAEPGDLRLARIAAIKKFIRRNYRTRALDMDEVVAYSFLSRRALYYLFEDEEFQVSGYIRALRTLEALELLTDASPWKRSLTGIAEVSGFTNLQAMRRAVRELTGFSLRDVQENAEVSRIRAAELRERIGP
jgi:AraC-like DNA-binding protein